MFKRRLQVLFWSAVLVLVVGGMLVETYYFVFHHRDWHAWLDWLYLQHPGVCAIFSLILMWLSIRDFTDPEPLPGAKDKVEARILLFGLAALVFGGMAVNEALHVL